MLYAMDNGWLVRSILHIEDALHPQQSFTKIQCKCLNELVEFFPVNWLFKLNQESPYLVRVMSMRIWPIMVSGSLPQFFC